MTIRKQTHQNRKRTDSEPSREHRLHTTEADLLKVTEVLADVERTIGGDKA